MLKSLISKAQAFLIGSVVLAVACGVAVIAAGYGVYAVIRIALSPAASAAVTAVVFAVVAGVAALMLLRTFSSKGDAKTKASSEPARSAQPVQMGMEAGMALVGLIADMIVSRREAKLDKDRSKHRKSR